MDDSKRWFQSKTVWTGIVTVLVAAYNAVTTQFHTPAVPEWIYALLGALGIYSRVTATAQIE